MVDGNSFVVENVLFTNTGMAFQDIFPLTFLMGSPRSAFSDFNRIVLTEKLAKRFWGDDWQSNN